MSTKKCSHSVLIDDPKSRTGLRCARCGAVEGGPLPSTIRSYARAQRAGKFRPDFAVVSVERDLCPVAVRL